MKYLILLCLLGASTAFALADAEPLGDFLVERSDHLHFPKSPVVDAIEFDFSKIFEGLFEKVKEAVEKGKDTFSEYFQKFLGLLQILKEEGLTQVGVLHEIMKKTVTGLKKLMEDAGGEVKTALQNLINRLLNIMGDKPDSFAERSRAWDGLRSTLEKVIVGLLEKLAVLVEEGNKMAETMVNQVIAAINTFGNMFGILPEGIQNLLKKVLDVVIKAITNAEEGRKAFLEGIADKIRKVIEKFGQSERLYKPALHAINLSIPKSPVVDAIQFDLSKIFEGLIEKVKEAVEKGKDTFSEYIQKFLGLLQILKEEGLTQVGVIHETLKKTVTGLKKLMEDAGGEVKTALQNLINRLLNIMGDKPEEISRARRQSLAANEESMLGRIIKFITERIEAGKVMAGGFLESMMGVASRILQGIEKAHIKIGEGLRKVLQKLVDVIKDKAQILPDNLREKVEEIASIIHRILERVIPGESDKHALLADPLMKQRLSILEGMLKGSLEKLMKLIQEVAEKGLGLLGPAINSAMEIVTNLINTINVIGGKLQESARSAIEPVLNAIKEIAVGLPEPLRDIVLKLVSSVESLFTKSYSESMFIPIDELLLY